MISDHIAILTHSSLATAQANKLKAGNPLEFFALLAFAPEAGPDLQAVALAAAQPNFGGLHADVSVGVERNSARKKPLPGIPGDWFIVRAVTRFAPEVYSAAGEQLRQDTPDGQSAIKTTFYAGKRVRANVTGYAWTHAQGGRGVSFNLAGIMDAGQGGDRLSIGNDSASTFAKFANPNAPAPIPASQSPAPAQTASPFGASQQQTAQPAQQANPFAQATGSANPFAPAA